MGINADDGLGAEDGLGEAVPRPRTEGPAPAQHVAPSLKKTAGTALMVALEIWSVADFAFGRRTLSWVVPRTAYLMIQILRAQSSESQTPVPTRSDEKAPASSKGPASAAEKAPASSPEISPEKGPASAPEKNPVSSNETAPEPVDGAKRSWTAASQEAFAWLGRETRKPTTAAALAGTAFLGISAVVGLTETALGAAASYAFYRALTRRRSAKAPPDGSSA